MWNNWPHYYNINADVKVNFAVSVVHSLDALLSTSLEYYQNLSLDEKYFALLLYLLHSWYPFLPYLEEMLQLIPEIIHCNFVPSYVEYEQYGNFLFPMIYWIEYFTIAFLLKDCNVFSHGCSNLLHYLGPFSAEVGPSALKESFRSCPLK